MPMGTSEEISRRYPKSIELDASLVPPGPQFLRIRPAGQPHQVQPVSLRLMGAADKAAMLQFARSLPQEDLLFLHSDITDPASVDEWIRRVDQEYRERHYRYSLSRAGRVVGWLRQPSCEPASMDTEGR